MRSAVFSLVALAAVAYAQSFQVNTPSNVASCEPLLIQWNGGIAPFFPAVLPGGQPSAAPLVTFNQTSSQSLTWLVNEPTGTSLGITIRDSTGALAQTASFTVQSGQTDCLNQTVSASAGSTAAGAPTSAPSSGSSGAPSPTSGSSSGASSAKSSSSGASSASSPANSSGAASGAISDRVAQFGVAGLLAAVGMAILA